MSIEIDCAVIGAGVVGLAVARALQLAGREVVLLEKERSFGTGTSSRNSEVIHAGIYYTPGSLKATLCTRGRSMLYAYCHDRGVPYARPGKIIVATSIGEVGILEGYLKTARANGVVDVEWIDAAKLNELEPALQAVRGLWSPSTGILDSHAFMQALLTDFEMAGGQFVRGTTVNSGRVVRGGIELRLIDRDVSVAKARTVINSAGLYAPHVARSIEGVPREQVPSPYYAVGHYYTLAGRSPFKHLIYPVAEKGGLGIHLTLDLSGAARFGPDVRWMSGVDYTFDDSRRDDFVSAISAYYPEIRASDLQVGYTGIRPKIVGPGVPAADFCIQDGRTYGAGGLINLFGIESPGLTSSLAIAESVCAIAEGQGMPGTADG